MSSKLGSRPRMRTYANRVKKDSQDSPAKRLCIEVINPSQDLSKEVSVAFSPVAKKKKSISDFFIKPTSEDPLFTNSRSKAHQPQRIHSSPPPLYETPPSSPPPSEPYDQPIKPLRRARRRLTTRPQIVKHIIKPSNMQHSKEVNDHVPGKNEDKPSRSDYFGSWEKFMPPVTTSDPTYDRRNEPGKQDPQEDVATSESNESLRRFPETLVPGSPLRSNPRQNPMFELPSSESSSSSSSSSSSDEAAVVEDEATRAASPEGKENEAEKKPTEFDSSSDDITLAGKRPVVLPSILGTGPFARDVRREAKASAKAAKAKLVQTQLSMGQKVLETCNECKFVYNGTDAADVKAHKKFHFDFENPFTVGNLRFHTLDAPKKIKTWIVDGMSEYIVGVDGQTTEPWKGMAVKFLKHIVGEFNGDEPPTEALWSTIPDPGFIVNGDITISDTRVNRYKMFLYVADDKVVSLLLAERITQGFVTHYGPMDMDRSGRAIPIDGEIRLYARHTNEMRHAALGIHYLWTDADYRGRGFGTRLLHAARRGGFLNGLQISRDLLAWTPPTTAGRGFASWYTMGRKDLERFDLMLYTPAMI